MSNQEREIMSNIKFDKSNIEEMEKQVNTLTGAINYLLKSADCDEMFEVGYLQTIRNFMRMSLDQHKDHIEKIAKLEKQIAEGKIEDTISSNIDIKELIKKSIKEYIDYEKRKPPMRDPIKKRR